MRVLALLAPLLAPLLAVSSSGCGNICNSDVCNELYRIHLEEPGGGPLRDGVYELSGVLDRETPFEVTCTISNGAVHAGCSSAVAHAPHFGTPETPVEEIFLDFPNGPMGGNRLPVHVELTVDHDGVLVVQEAFDVMTHEIEPKCKPGCLGGADTVEFTR